MNHTKNYGLPQWELNDLIRMEDFNSAMGNIESGIDGAKAEAKADSNEAKAVANSAKVTANAAKSAADTALASKPYVTGSYTGNDYDRVITLGFRPSFLIVSGMEGSISSSYSDTYDRYFGMTAGNVLKGRLELTDTGFIAKGYGSTMYPYFTDGGRRYDYIAFK